MSQRAIYKYEQSYGRNGDLESVFVEYVEVMDALIAEGPEVSLGEALGKHSDVFATIDASTITKVSDSPEAVAVFADHVGTVGHDVVSVWAEHAHEDASELMESWRDEYPSYAIYAKLYGINVCHDEPITG